jgi:osmotically-inducible protein OsmY
MKAILSGLLCLSLLGCGRPSSNVPVKHAVNTPGGAHAANSDDKSNTALNARDRDGKEKTPIDQNENQADIDTTASIRKRVMAEKLSTEAHNVKIITQNGQVTLRGPVKSEEEKESIEAVARDIAGAGNVESKLEVDTK